MRPSKSNNEKGSLANETKMKIKREKSLITNPIITRKGLMKTGRRKGKTTAVPPPH